MGDTYTVEEAPAALVREIAEWCPELVAGPEQRIPAYVAGGFIRAFMAGEPRTDLDLFCESKTDARVTWDRLGAAGYRRVFSSPLAETLAPPGLHPGRVVQVVLHTCAPPAAMLSTFDFTVCCAALTFDWPAGQARLLLHPEFYRHLAGRLLVYQPGAPRPISSVKRVCKYVRRGYRIPEESLLALLQAVSTMVKWDDPSSVRAMGALYCAETEAVPDLPAAPATSSGGTTAG